MFILRKEDDISNRGFLVFQGMDHNISPLSGSHGKFRIQPGMGKWMGRGMMSGLPDEQRERVERHPWDRTLPRLLAHARARVRERFWAGVIAGPMPGGLQAEDMVNIAVEKFLGGKRQWNPTFQPDLEDFLRGIIDSEISHLAEGWENRHIRPEAAILGDEKEIGGLADIPGDMINVEEELANRQEYVRAEAFASGFIATLSDEPLLQRVAGCIVDGLCKPAVIAAELGIEVEEIYRVRKRLQRRLEEFYRQWRKAGQSNRAGGMPWN